MTALGLALFSVLAQIADERPEDEVRVSADEAEARPSTRQVELRGHARLEVRSLRLAADRITYDDQTGIAVAEGNVLLAEGALAAAAARVTLGLPELSLAVDDGALFEKVLPPGVDPIETGSRSALESLGRNALTLRGERLVRLGPRRYAVDGIRFTPCACPGERADWRIDAARADVELGERAILYWPVFRILDVPVLAFPVLYLPLSDRRSGFLVPRVVVRGGLQIEEPIFLTLGESRDLTLSPGYSGLFQAAEVAAGGSPQRQYVRGPRVALEYRYATEASRNGRATIVGVWDLNRDLDGAGGFGPPRGPRGSFQFLHRRDGELVGERAEVTLSTDANLLGDTVGDIRTREAEYQRSTASMFVRRGAALAWLEASYLQDLRAWAPPGMPRPLFSGSTPRPFGRLPAFSAAAPLSVWGPFRAVFNGSVARFAPLDRAWADEGADGVGPGDRGYRGADVGEGDGRFTPGEQPGAVRVDLAPEAVLAGAFGRFLVAEARVGYRQDVWLQSSGGVAHRGYPMFRVLASTRLERVFEGATRWRHVIEPRLELRAIPLQWGNPDPREGVPFAPIYDEVEMAPGIWNRRAVSQGLASVATEINVAGAGGPATPVRLELGQGYHLQSPIGPRASDFFARASIDLSATRADAVVVADPRRGSLRQLSLRGAVGELGRNEVFFQLDHFDAAPAERLNAGADVLFAWAPEAAGTFDQASLGLRLSHGSWLAVRYEMLVHPPTAAVLQHSGGLTLRSACDCWRFELNVLWRPGLTFPELGASLTLERLGSVGT